jgi:AcrR family transcriptional regulator
MASKDKRETILQAALELIAEHGFHGAPMSAVAQRAGVSAGIIYHYFASKEDLIHALYKQVKTDFSRALLPSRPQALPLPDTFQQIWLNAYHFYRTHPHEARFLEQYKQSPFYQAGRQPAELMEGGDFAFFAELFEGDRAERPFKDLPFDVLYELTLGVAICIARRHTTDANALSDEMLARIAAACWQAVAR